jgi:hypothetical protein
LLLSGLTYSPLRRDYRVHPVSRSPMALFASPVECFAVAEHETGPRSEGVRPPRDFRTFTTPLHNWSEPRAGLYGGGTLNEAVLIHPPVATSGTFLPSQSDSNAIAHASYNHRRMVTIRRLGVSWHSRLSLRTIGVPLSFRGGPSVAHPWAFYYPPGVSSFTKAYRFPLVPPEPSALRQRTPHRSPHLVGGRLLLFYWP